MAEKRKTKLLQDVQRQISCRGKLLDRVKPTCKETVVDEGQSLAGQQPDVVNVFEDGGAVIQNDVVNVLGMETTCPGVANSTKAREMDTTPNLAAVAKQGVGEVRLDRGDL